MPSALPTPGDCCTTCETETVSVPGPQGDTGPAGANGTNGTDGADAWTTTTANFTMPAVGLTVGVFVGDSSFMFVGMIVQVEGAGGMEVTAVPTALSCTLENLGWAINAAPATVIASGATVAPSGPEGATGAAGAPTNANYWVNVANATLTSETVMGALASGYLKVTTGTGVPSSVATIPYTHIDTSAVASPTTKVLKPSGTVATSGQVEDDEIEYECIALTPGANVDIDWALGRVFTMTLTVNTTFTFSNLVAGKSIMVILTQHAAAAKTVDFPVATYWPGGTEVEISTTLSSKAVYSFVYDGATVIGTITNDCS